MHCPININDPVIYNDLRAPEVKQLLGSFDKESYVYINKSNVVILTDNSVIYNFNLKLEVDDRYPNLAFKIEDVMMLDENCLSYDKAIHNFIYKVWTNILYNNGILISDIEELRGDEQFEKLIAMKAGEGMHYYKLPRLDIPGKCIMIPIFSGFPKLTKQDKIGVKVYKDIIQNNLLIHFHIYKKKFNRYIEMYFRILDI